MVAFVIVNGTDAEIEPNVAVMVTVPGATPNATPPELSRTIKLEGSEGDDQATSGVTLWVLPSLNVPVAVKTFLVP